MANPNIVNLTTIYPGLATLAPANITANALVTNASSSNAVVKINSLTATNVTNLTATVTVAIVTASSSAVAARLVYQITVPPNASLQVVDKGNFVYLTEDKRIDVTSGTASAIEYVASYETIG
jgi:hypothetical protein